LIDFRRARWRSHADEQLKDQPSTTSWPRKIRSSADEVDGQDLRQLGAAAPFRHFNPACVFTLRHARISSEMALRAAELHRQNWRTVDNRVKSFQSTPPTIWSGATV
jgi:hypothetical protein